MVRLRDPDGDGFLAFIGKRECQSRKVRAGMQGKRPKRQGNEIVAKAPATIFARPDIGFQSESQCGDVRLPGNRGAWHGRLILHGQYAGGIEFDGEISAGNGGDGDFCSEELVAIQHKLRRVHRPAAPLSRVALLALGIGGGSKAIRPAEVIPVIDMKGNGHNVLP